MKEIFGTIAEGLEATIAKSRELADTHILPSKHGSAMKKILVVGLILAVVLYLLGRSAQKKREAVEA